MDEFVKTNYKKQIIQKKSNTIYFKINNRIIL